MSIAKRLEQTQHRLLSVLTKDLAGQVATLLLDECGGSTEGRPAVALPHQTIGQMVGARRPSVSRVVDQLRRRGLIESRYRDAELADREPVMVVERGGETHVYPLAILTFQEIVNDVIVNDVIAGQPTLVTYCPLCNSALAFDPVVDGRVLDFGTSGRLWRSNLVMYDRQTHTLTVTPAGRSTRSIAS